MFSPDKLLAAAEILPNTDFHDHKWRRVIITFWLPQVTKDIEDVEKLLDHMSSKMDASAVGYDPEQLTVKFAEEEVWLHDLW